MIYKTSLDNVAKGITVFITILFATIIVGINLMIAQIGDITPVFISVLIILIYFIVFAYRPIHYNITTDSIIIHRLFKDVRIVRVNIKSIALIDKEKLRGSLRVFGVGGLFGYFGKFANMKIGKMTWYATRRENQVLIITTDDKNIILTPDDAAGFVADVNSQG